MLEQASVCWIAQRTLTKLLPCQVSRFLTGKLTLLKLQTKNSKNLYQLAAKNRDQILLASVCLGLALTGAVGRYRFHSSAQSTFHRYSKSEVVLNQR